ncbi:MAG: class I SAM-dependent methyltransferase [Bacteroidota bacterium]
MTAYLNSSFDLSSPELISVLDEVPVWSAPFGLQLLDNIRFKSGMHVLDIGCGTGFPLTEIALRLGKSCKIFGLDPWGAALNRAHEKTRVYGLDNVELLQGKAEAIPLEDSSMDLITSNNGLNNVEDLKQSLSECYRVIREGGQFLQTINLETTMVEFYNVMEDVLKDRDMDEARNSMKQHIHEKRKPLREYLGFIKDSGFTINELKHHQFQYKFADGTTMLNHYFIRMAFLDSWKKIVPVQKQEEIFLTIESALNLRAGENGYLPLTIPFVTIDCMG